LEEIYKRELTFPKSKQTSNEFKMLVKEMLRIDASKRINILSIKNHVWFQLSYLINREDDLKKKQKENIEIKEEEEKKGENTSINDEKYKEIVEDYISKKEDKKIIYKIQLPKKQELSNSQIKIRKTKNSNSVSNIGKGSKTPHHAIVKKPPTSLSKFGQS